MVDKQNIFLKLANIQPKSVHVFLRGTANLNLVPEKPDLVPDTPVLVSAKSDLVSTRVNSSLFMYLEQEPN